MEGTKGSAGKGRVGRRDLMKIGAGVGVAAIGGVFGASNLPGRQESAPDNQYQPIVQSLRSGNGKPVAGSAPYITPHMSQGRTAKYGDFMNTSGRSFGNGPMDETTGKIVEFATLFKPDLSDAVVKDAIGTMFIDTLGSAIAAFETDSIRGGARLAKLYPAGELKSTVWGYGIQTTPDLAGFVGSCAVRHFDNNSAGMHETDMIPGILAVAEAVHASGTQVLEAIVLFWEVFGALLGAKYRVGAPGDRGVDTIIDNHDHAPATAVAVSKLLGLNQDQMANAISLSFVDHMALSIDHSEEPDSMSKSNHDAELCRAAVFAALQARSGITGPASPFEGVKGLMDCITGRFTVTLPCKLRNDVGGYPSIPLGPNEDEYVVQSLSYKRYPGNGGVPISSIVPAFRQFCKVEDIESIDMEVNSWGDGAGPMKFDPLNDDTADHSIQYCFARLLMDGDLFIDAYTPEKLKDPAIRALMGKITQREVPGSNSVTIKTKAGQTMTQKSEGYKTRMTHEEINRKYDRHCAYRGVSNAQRDKIRDTWVDLRNVKDIAVTIRETLAHYGKPQPV